MTRAINSDLDHPAYHEAVSLPKYNCKVDVFRATCPMDGARVLRRTNPAWTQEDHLRLSQLHAERSALERARHAQLLDDAAQATFGRPFAATDYRISAIGSDEFSETMKTALRYSAHARTHHLVCARAHAKAANPRSTLRF